MYLKMYLIKSVAPCTVGTVKVIKRDLKVSEVGFMFCLYPGNLLFRADAFFLGT